MVFPFDLIHRLSGLGWVEFESSVQAWVQLEVVVKRGDCISLAHRVRESLTAGAL